jgi:hypothetical protein
VGCGAAIKVASSKASNHRNSARAPSPRSLFPSYGPREPCLGGISAGTQRACQNIRPAFARRRGAFARTSDDVCPAARRCAIEGSCGCMAKHRAGEGFMSRPIPFVRVDKPLMVFGGPYSNLEATRAVLEEAARLSISADHIICTGDVVAYGADAAATVIWFATGLAIAPRSPGAMRSRGQKRWQYREEPPGAGGSRSRSISRFRRKAKAHEPLASLPLPRPQDVRRSAIATPSRAGLRDQPPLSGPGGMLV